MKKNREEERRGEEKIRNEKIWKEADKERKKKKGDGMKERKIERLKVGKKRRKKE